MHFRSTGWLWAWRVHVMFIQRNELRSTSAVLFAYRFSLVVSIYTNKYQMQNWKYHIARVRKFVCVCVCACVCVCVCVCMYMCVCVVSVLEGGISQIHLLTTDKVQVLLEDDTLVPRPVQFKHTHGWVTLFWHNAGWERHCWVLTTSCSLVENDGLFP